MKEVRYILIAVVVLGIAGIAGAVGPMTLTGAGDLYKVAAHDNQIVVTARYADGAVSEFIVPQSAGAVTDSLQVGVDEATGALYVLWQKKTGMDARLRLAGHLDGTWIGPFTFAGHDGTAAYNPQLLIHRAVSLITEDGAEDEEPVVTELATTFLHLAWWSQYDDDDPGLASAAVRGRIRNDSLTASPASISRSETTSSIPSFLSSQRPATRTSSPPILQTASSRSSSSSPRSSMTSSATINDAGRSSSSARERRSRSAPISRSRPAGLRSAAVPR